MRARNNTSECWNWRRCSFIWSRYMSIYVCAQEEGRRWTARREEINAKKTETERNETRSRCYGNRFVFFFSSFFHSRRSIRDRCLSPPLTCIVVPIFACVCIHAGAHATLQITNQRLMKPKWKKKLYDKKENKIFSFSSLLNANSLCAGVWQRLFYYIVRFCASREQRCPQTLLDMDLVSVFAWPTAYFHSFQCLFPNAFVIQSQPLPIHV